VTTSSPTVHHATVRLADGSELRVNVTYGGKPDPAALPMSALPHVVELAVDGDVASAADVGAAILDLLALGEAAQRESVRSSADLAATVAAVEAARAVEREQ
jgi:hypothetical protein